MMQKGTNWLCLFMCFSINYLDKDGGERTQFPCVDHRMQITEGAGLRANLRLPPVSLSARRSVGLRQHLLAAAEVGGVFAAHALF